MPEPLSRVRLQLAAELQTARTLAGLNQRAMAAAVGVSQALVSRVEHGERLLSRPDSVKWLRAAKSSTEVRDRVLALVEAAHTATETWAQLFASQRHLQDVARDRAAEARLMQDYSPSWIPGLLQTADYARAIIPIADVAGTIDHGAALAARIERQGILADPGERTFHFVIAERVLRWAPAPGVLGPQMAQLLAAAKHPHVEIAVLPESFAGTLQVHNFVLRYLADTGSPYVEVELFDGRHDVHEAESVGIYLKVWRRMWDGAARGDHAAALIRAAAD